MCFDIGFGPLRRVCTSGKPEDLQKTDEIACQVLEEMMKDSPKEIQQQMQDNITWIKGAQENKLVVGSQARILYADAEGRMKIAEAFNQAIAKGEIGPVVLGRDHHEDRKSTRLNSSHVKISYAVFCLKKKKKGIQQKTKQEKKEIREVNNDTGTI